MAKTRESKTKQTNYLKRHGWRDREEYLSHLYNRKNKQWNELVKALSTIADVIGELDLQALGRQGGRTRAKNLSKRELSKIGKAAAAKRWAKAKKGGE